MNNTEIVTVNQKGKSNFANTKSCMITATKSNRTDAPAILEMRKKEAPVL